MLEELYTRIMDVLVTDFNEMESGELAVLAFMWLFAIWGFSIHFSNMRQLRKSYFYKKDKRERKQRRIEFYRKVLAFFGMSSRFQNVVGNSADSGMSFPTDQR